MWGADRIGNVSCPTGAPGESEVEAKFLTLASPIIGEANAVRLKEALLQLESLSVRDALRSCAVA